jgi:hypothetical protein
MHGVLAYSLLSGLPLHKIDLLARLFMHIEYVYVCDVAIDLY